METLKEKIKELDVHYQDCDTAMGKVRHESHGELCGCDNKCDCSALEDLLKVFTQEKKAMLNDIEEITACSCIDAYRSVLDKME